MKKTSTNSTTQQTITIPQDIIDRTIIDVHKLHFLGSANTGADSNFTSDKYRTGRLSGFHRDIIAKTIDIYFNKPNQKSIRFEGLLMSAASLSYTGAGNCGEMATALRVRLWCDPTLTKEQKKSVEYWIYPTNDTQGVHSYIKIGETIYNIWADEKYDAKELEQRTSVSLRNHKPATEEQLSLLEFTTEQIYKFFTLYTKKFAEIYLEVFTANLQANIYYPTLNNDDSNEKAILARPAFTHLYNKLLETLEDKYYLENKTVAKEVRSKILTNFIFLLEALRQDYPLDKKVVNKRPNRKKVSEEELREVFYQCIPDKLIADIIFSLSYQRSNKEKCINLLKGLTSTNPKAAELLLAIDSDVYSQIFIPVSNDTSNNNNTTSTQPSTVSNMINRNEHPLYASATQQQPCQEQHNPASTYIPTNKSEPSP